MYQSFGKDNADHALEISSAGYNWNHFEQLHHNEFEKLGLEKYCLVDEKNAILARAVSANMLQTNASAPTSVRHEDFLSIQQILTEVRRKNLNGIADLMAAGLSFPEKITTQIVGFESESDGKDAIQEMNPETYDNDDSEFILDNVPLPITHASFNVKWRQLGFDYKRQVSVRTRTRKVMERLEKTLFNGNSDIKVNFNGAPSQIFGYTNLPGVATGIVSDWTNNAERDKIVPEAIDQVGALWTDATVQDNSVIMYVSTKLFPILQKQFLSSHPTIKIIDELRNIQWIKDVKHSINLSDKEVVMVEMEANTVQLAVASDVIAVPHIKLTPIAAQPFTVYAAMVQLFRKDANDKIGIRKLSLTGL